MVNVAPVIYFATADQVHVAWMYAAIIHAMVFYVERNNIKRALKKTEDEWDT